MATNHGLLLDTAYSKLGAWYHWGGNGPETFDCSGYICFCWRAAGYRSGDYSADTMFDNFRLGRWGADAIVNLTDLRAGDIVFYGGSSDHASHVVMALSPHYVIGASGGFRSVDTIEEAKAKNAKVRIDRIDYRKDRIGLFRPHY